MMNDCEECRSMKEGGRSSGFGKTRSSGLID